MKFKIGDKVKIKKDCNNEGCEAIIIKPLSDGTNYYLRVINPKQIILNDKGESYNDLENENNLELIKPMKINYILSYDTPNRDPIEYFEKLSEVEDRIEQLTRQNGALLDTIQVFEVKKVGKVRGIKINIVFE